MLKRVEIQGLLFMKKVSVDFTSGFNVITGETGSGKSVLLKALNLLTGGKGSSELVNKNFKQMTLAGFFELDLNHVCFAFLDDIGVEKLTDDPNRMILRRTITQKGRSNCWVNDTPITLKSLKKLGDMVMDMFAQHDHHNLLLESSHTNQADAFNQNQKKYLDYKTAFHQVMTEFSSLNEFVEEYHKKIRNLDYLMYKKNKFDQLAPKKGEYQQLIDFSKSSDTLLKKKLQLFNVSEIIDHGYGGKSLSHAMRSALKILSGIESQEELININHDLENLAVSLDDFSFQINRTTQLIDIDERSIEEAQERIAEYQSFMRSLGTKDENTLLDEKNKIEQEIDFINTATDEFRARIDVLYKNCQELLTISSALTQERKKSIEVIKRKVAKEFSDLGMKHAKFNVEILPHQASQLEFDIDFIKDQLSESEQVKIDYIIEILGSHKSEGCERVRFLLATSPGDDLQPLVRIASGGEVSRIMLALKRSLLSKNGSSIMIFDEIDTGISGRIADKVGKKLKEISDQVQIICISHLAQVVSYANHHVVVNKIIKEQETVISIKGLDESEKIKEVARILSGDKVTKMSLANAKNLLDRSSVYHASNGVMSESRPL